MNSQFFVLVVILALPVVALAESPIPSWQMLDGSVDASLRGLCVVDANVVWASGTGGTVVRSGNAGKKWHVVPVAGAGTLDFRDIHAFDAKHAVVISAGQPARVYQTTDGGENWSMRYQHTSEKSFFDSMSFWDRQHGIAMSDPIDDHVLLIETLDGGSTWNELPSVRRPQKERGEAGFAASGTNMCVLLLDRVYIALGGGEEGQAETQSRVVYSFDRAQTWKASKVPMPRGPSSGIFSLAFADVNNGIAVGGDYKSPDESAGNIAITTDGGKSWKLPSGKSPGGFRSGIASREMGEHVVWVAVGTNGTDYSVDGGDNWTPVSKTGFHAVQFSGDTSAGFACGGDGRIAKWLAD